MLMIAAPRGRNEPLHIQFQQFIAAVTEYPLRSFIDDQDPSGRVHFKNRVRGRLQQLVEPFFCLGRSNSSSLLLHQTPRFGKVSRDFGYANDSARFIAYWGNRKRNRDRPAVFVPA